MPERATATALNYSVVVLGWQVWHEQFRAGWGFAPAA